MQQQHGQSTKTDIIDLLKSIFRKIHKFKIDDQNIKKNELWRTVASLRMTNSGQFHIKCGLLGFNSV